MTAAANNRSSVSAAVRFYQRIAADSARRQAFERMLVEDGYGDLERYCLGAERFYGRVDPEGKEVLEIGSGRGLTIMFSGAAECAARGEHGARNSPAPAAACSRFSNVASPP